jgi:hypothetical protein
VDWPKDFLSVEPLKHDKQGCELRRIDEETKKEIKQLVVLVSATHRASKAWKLV